MNKQEFKDKQIELYSRERILHSDTQKVLCDLLNAMTDDEREKLAGTELDVYKEIVSMDANGLVYVDTDVNEEYDCSLDELSQVQQKEIIDTILFNIWGI